MAGRSVLWWGRFDPDYSRNRVLRQAFRELGWAVVDFRPRTAQTGALEARLAGLSRPDLVWVPCFRQRDVAAARRWADRMQLPLVFDPLISAYDKQVNERRILNQDSLRARRLLRQEARQFQSADLLIADTRAHADYFSADFAVPQGDVLVIPVGAEEGMFRPLPQPAGREGVEVLFYGTFIDLQGPRVIVEAAKACTAGNVTWTMLGAGPLRQECEALATEYGLNNIRFEDWVAYEKLPERIARADILLGAFGVSGKASRVIPNKVYQSLACGRTVLTRQSSAYPQELQDERDGLVQIEAGSPAALARAVETFAREPERIASSNTRAHGIYQQHFSSGAILSALQQVLTRVLPG